MMKTSFGVLFSMLIVAITWLGPAALAQPPNPCEAILKDAEEKYTNAQFEQAIVLLNTCLSQAGIASKDKIAAYKLLAQVYVSKGEPEPAKKIFGLILSLDPNFTLVAGQERPNVMQVFAEAQREMQNKGGSKKKLLIIGGSGVAVAAIMVAVLAGGSGGADGSARNTEGGFPKPPVRP